MIEPIQPNFHAVLVHFPIALLFLGTFIAVFSFLGWRNSSVRVAGRWMILFGALGSFAATFSGLYALRDVASLGRDEILTWNELRATNLLSNNITSDLMFDHLWLGVGASAGAMLIVMIWIASSDRARAVFQVPLALLLLCVVGLTAVAANYGGQAVYEHGVGVSKTVDVATTNPSHTLVDFVSPIQLHVTLAGLAIGLTLVSIATSWRAAVELKKPVLPALRQEQEAALIAEELSDEPLVAYRAPAGRAWLIGFLLLLLTASSGIWFLAQDSGSWSFVDLKAQIISDNDSISRRNVHVVAGIALLVVPLVFAFFSRVARRSRLMILLLLPATLALLVVQVWVGCMLLFDTPDGPTFKFQPAPAQVAQSN